MSGKGLFVVGAVVVGVAGSVVVYRGLSARPPAHTHSAIVSEAKQAETPSNDADVARLRAELGLLQGQISTLRERMDEEKTAPKPAEAVPVEELDPAALQKGREEDVRLWKEHMVEVAAAFDEEAVDRSFATVATGAVDKAIQNDPVIQAAAGKVDCRSRTCRLELKSDADGKVKKQLPLFLQQVGGTLANAQGDHFEDESGASTVVLFLTNEQPVAQLPRR